MPDVQHEIAREVMLIKACATYKEKCDLLRRLAFMASGHDVHGLAHLIRVILMLDHAGR